MNPALIASMNFLLQSTRKKEEEKVEIEKSMTAINKWYVKADKEDLEMGYVRDNEVADLIFRLYQEHRIKLDFVTGKWNNQ